MTGAISLVEIDEMTTREHAADMFLRLVGMYGVRWGPKVPSHAYAAVEKVSMLLTPEDKRKLLRGEVL